ncbi:ferrous iron transport protein B [Thermodesulfobacteriota bacterium]
MKKITIALAGNPNSGKTTVFNAITGARQHIANYPGVTVEKKFGKIHHKGYEVEIVDLPGTYSLTAYSLEEIVARNYLINERPDLVVNIVDASNLDRNLYLAVQFKELGVPLIIALNMIDVATTRGIVVDQEFLSASLDVPVVPTVARSKRGITDLLDKIVEVAGESPAWQPVSFSYGRDIDQSLEDIGEIIEEAHLSDGKYPSRWLALKSLERDEQIVSLMKGHAGANERINAICEKTLKHTMDTLEEEPEGIIADHRYGYIAGITKKAVKRKVESRLNLSDKMDRILTNRIIGPLTMLTILYGVYEFTFGASEAPIRWLEGFFAIIKNLLTMFIPEGIFQSLVVSGIIDGVGGVIGFVPLIMLMFFAIAVMEDSGYLARVAYMLDRVLRWFGLHGNSVMALLISGGISGGCAVPGVMATRTLKDPKERITTLLVVPFMNCGAKLPVFVMLIAAFFQEHQARMLFALTLLSWGFALFAAKIIRSTLLRGPKSPFVMELPPYRVPTLKGLLIHTWERTWQYIKKAGTIILGISIILWAMMTFPEMTGDQREMFKGQRQEVRVSFLNSPEVKKIIKNERALAVLDARHTGTGNRPGSKGDAVKGGNTEDEALATFADEVAHLRDGKNDLEQTGASYRKAAREYLDYRERMRDVIFKEQQFALKGTIAGRIGLALEKVTHAIGFDYRTNIALIGGFAAKEVIVSTLGTAYSLGEVDSEESTSLSERLRKDPRWNPLVAFCLILFTMLYVPCFVTVVSIKRESSIRWAVFSIIFNIIVAFVVTFVVFRVGSFLGLGV